jgi:hypothetical protein
MAHPVHMDGMAEARERYIYVNKENEMIQDA